MSFLSDVEFTRLHDSINWSNRKLDKPRAERLRSIKQFVGSHYADAGSQKTVPTNFLKLAVDIFVRLLSARAPRVLLTTRDQTMRPTVANLEIAVNQIPEEIGLAATLRRITTEAMFSFGIVKMGLATVDKILGHEYGESFVDDVTIDDYFCDMTTGRRDLIQYEGNDYWLPYDKVMESKWFENKDGLKADEYAILGESGQDRAESITMSETPTLYKDKVWLRDVWLPEENVLVTYAVKSERRLKTTKWNGPDGGPYLILGFSDVPGNILPLPPVSVWYDLHELGNALYRKLATQADSQKTVLGFPGGDVESVDDFKKAKDGDGIRYTGIKPEKLTAGGVDPTTLAFFLNNRDLYAYFAGNLDSLGGLAPMTETVGQDKLLSESAGAQLRDMRAKTVEFNQLIFKALAYYEWHDPVRQRSLEKTIPNTDLSIQVPWTPRTRKGKYPSFDLKVDVFSLQDDSPQLKLQRLGLLIERYILPLEPFIQQQGGTVDVRAILGLVAKYADFPELDEIVQFVQDLGLAPQGQGAGPKKPTETTRRYERVNRPGATEGGKSQILQQALLGGRPQGSEMESIGRSTS